MMTRWKRARLTGMDGGHSVGNRASARSELPLSSYKEENETSEQQ